jgi:hypothetical protein
MPNSSEFDASIFNEQFSKFLNEIESSHQKATYSPEAGPSVRIMITFDPAQRFFSGNYLDYTVTFTLSKNPVYNRLKTKAAQLKKAGFRGVMGIVLCDAGCSVLNHRGRHGINVGIDDIIANFLKEEPHISFVMTLLVESDGSGRLGSEHLKIVRRMYLSNGHPAAAPLATFLTRSLTEQIPRPETTPINAYSESNEGRSFFGGGKMTPHSIKISAREVLEVLSGYKRQDEFIRDNPLAERFGKMLSEGRLFSEVQIEHVPDSDDDWIEFHFSEPDCAISAFKRRTAS